MRISTSMMFDAGRGAIMRQSAQLLHTQQQIGADRRILSPADDPIAAARALEVTQSQRANEQFQTNIGSANDALAMLDSDLGMIGDILTYIRTRAIEAGNAAYSDKEHQDIASDIEAQFDSLLGIANSKDATGEYRYAGYRSDVEPFSFDPLEPILANQVTYSGDWGARSIQVAPSRIMEVGEPGAKIFGVDDTTGESSVFTAIATFIDGLKNPGGIAATVSDAIDDMDAALENILTIRASVGSRMVELESLESISGAYSLQYAQTLSRLQDLDYAEAYSRLAQQKTVLEAAQQSFIAVTGLSLFKLLG